MSKDNTVYITVALPVFNEDKDTIKEVYIRLTEVLIRLQRGFEIIFVDDGSTNGIFNILKEINAMDKHVKVIRFTKNFGQISAFLAAFEHARGEIIITMDSDLQSSPEDIPKFIEKINQGFDAVSGWRQGRNDHFLIRKLPSKLMNKLLITKTHIKLHDWTCSFNAIKRDIITKFLKVYNNKSLFIKPSIVSLCSKIAEIKVKHFSRGKRKSRYNLISLIKLFLDYIFDLSYYLNKNNNPPFLIQEILS